MTTVICEQKHKDLGNVPTNSEINVEFELTNAGLEDLDITGVTTSCGCTASDWPRKAVKPGDQTTITLTFDTTNRSGSHEKSAKVHGNFLHDMVLTFKANIYGLD